MIPKLPKIDRDIQELVRTISAIAAVIFSLALFIVKFPVAAATIGLVVLGPALLYLSFGPTKPRK